MSENNVGVSRRTLVKGAAWAVPVIAAAVAVPANAAATGSSRTNVGNLVESSPQVSDTNTRLSAARVEACFSDPEKAFPAGTVFELTATLTYSGSLADFTLANTTIESAVPGFWKLVSATVNQVTVRATGAVTCYVGLPALNYEYNVPGTVPPELNTLYANITGVSVDGVYEIGALTNAIGEGQPVIGPGTRNAPLG